MDDLSGFAALLGGMPFWLVVAVAAAIIFARGQAYYWAGRGAGTKLYTSKLGRRIGEHRLRKVEAFVRRRGAVAVFGAHWVAGFRHAIPVCAGIIRMPYAGYLVASALGSVLWILMLAVGGYTVVWGWLSVAARSPVLAGVIVAAFAAGIIVLVRLRRTRAVARRAGREG
ncbi:VTT domain-containing protein [Nonomuraea sp. NBC_01738]|uniref:DedA family protein n=1 Tax=Nonomuraea sp. NBC_01738 TaxID=2976003 RepID=UPI002E1229DD|nr:VTT domain-containing protein [Nonomuraea sp. NBC_01738]